MNKETDTYFKEQNNMSTSDQVITISDGIFDEKVIKSDKPFLLDLSAEWCGPCRAIGPVIDELATEFEGKINFGKMDVDQNPKTPAQYQVQSIPTLLLFNQGKVVGQLTGAHPRARIVELLNKAL